MCNGEQRGGDYKANRPGCFTGGNMDLIAHAWSPPSTCTTKTCVERNHQVFARKFSSKRPDHVKALDTADRAAAAWDDQLKAGLFTCPDDTRQGRSRTTAESFKGEL